MKTVKRRSISKSTKEFPIENTWDSLSKGTNKLGSCRSNDLKNSAKSISAIGKLCCCCFAKTEVSDYDCKNEVTSRPNTIPGDYSDIVPEKSDLIAPFKESDPPPSEITRKSDSKSPESHFTLSDSQKKHLNGLVQHAIKAYENKLMYESVPFAMKKAEKKPVELKKRKSKKKEDNLVESNENWVHANQKNLYSDIVSDTSKATNTLSAVPAGRLINDSGEESSKKYNRKDFFVDDIEECLKMQSEMIRDISASVKNPYYMKVSKKDIRMPKDKSKKKKKDFSKHKKASVIQPDTIDNDLIKDIQILHQPNKVVNRNKFYLNHGGGKCEKPCCLLKNKSPTQKVYSVKDEEPDRETNKVTKKAENAKPISYSSGELREESRLLKKYLKKCDKQKSSFQSKIPYHHKEDHYSQSSRKVSYSSEESESSITEIISPPISGDKKYQRSKKNKDCAPIYLTTKQQKTEPKPRKEYIQKSTRKPKDIRIYSSMTASSDSLNLRKRNERVRSKTNKTDGHPLFYYCSTAKKWILKCSDGKYDIPTPLNAPEKTQCPFVIQTDTVQMLGYENPKVLCNYEINPVSPRAVDIHLLNSNKYNCQPPEYMWNHNLVRPATHKKYRMEPRSEENRTVQKEYKFSHGGFVSKIRPYNN